MSENDQCSEENKTRKREIGSGGELCLPLHLPSLTTESTARSPVKHELRQTGSGRPEHVLLLHSHTPRLTWAGQKARRSACLGGSTERNAVCARFYELHPLSIHSSQKLSLTPTSLYTQTTFWDSGLRNVSQIQLLISLLCQALIQKKVKVTKGWFYSTRALPSLCALSPLLPVCFLNHRFKISITLRDPELPGLHVTSSHCPPGLSIPCPHTWPPSELHWQCPGRSVPHLECGPFSPLFCS